MGHGTQPIPTAALVGPLLVSGGVSGIDRADGTLPEDPASQVINLFDNVAAVLSAAGGSMDDVVKFSIAVVSKDVRRHLNPVWERQFPDALSRPARHVVVSTTLPAGMHVQCEVTAWLDR